MTLVIRNQINPDGSASYTFTYRIMGKEMSLDVDASPATGRSGPQVSSCIGSSYVHKGPEDPAGGTRSFINAAGNFERASGGKTLIVCTRKPQ